MKAYVMMLVGLANGDASPLEGEYLVEYDPPAMRADGRGYEGGTIATSRDITKAIQFEDAGALLECWRKANGTRPDGKPNRPLTAYTVESVRVDPCP
jgi:ribosome modulation factor